MDASHASWTERPGTVERRRLVRPSIAVVVAALAALSACGGEPTGTPANEERDLESRLGTPRARDLPTVGSGLVHEIATPELASANERYWAEERVSDYLVARPLQDLKRILLGPWSRATRRPEPSAVFTEDARIAPPIPSESADERLTLGVVRRRWPDASGERVLMDVEAWMAALAELHAGSARVRWALVKPVEVSIAGDVARVRLAWNLNRELPGGGLAHDQGTWTSEWVAPEGGDDPEWRCRRLVPEEGCATLVSEAPHWVDVTGEAFRGTPLDPRLPTARMGMNRGVALGDLDGDGDLDLVTTIPNRVLYNRGDGTFDDRTKEVLPPEHAGFWRSRGGVFAGVLIEDFDRDGAPDIVMAGKLRRSVLFVQRDGVFEARPIESSSDRNLPASLSAQDVDGDGWLDLFIAGYGPFMHPGPNDPTNATNARGNQLLRGLSGGRFEDVTERWGFDREGTRWTFIGAFGDADGDGDVDLYAANDFGPNVLYRRADDAVEFRAELESPADVDAGFSMSATWGDLDGDLDLDLYVSNMSSTAARRVTRMPGDPTEERLVPLDLDELRLRMSKGNTLLLSDGRRLREAGAEYGAKRASWAWGTALFDYDCDGDLDIHCVNGFWSQGADDGRDL